MVWGDRSPAIPVSSPPPGRCWRQDVHKGTHDPALPGGSDPAALGTGGCPSTTLVQGHPPGTGETGWASLGYGKGGGSALLTVLGVAAVAPPFAPESPNIGVLCLRLSCCGFVAFPVPIAMLPGARAPAELATAAGRLPLLRGER